MNIKEEGSRRPSSGIKILNDEQIVPLPLPIMTSVPLSPCKQVNISIAKSKTASPKKQMDHYVLQTFKGESNEGGVEDETIDFIFTDNNESQQMTGLSAEITEELHLSGDEDGDEKTEEIVEHICGKCYKSFRRFSGLKKHLDFCRFDSGYHLRKAQMLKNLEKIEKDAVIMENKDICFCCGESYDTFHLGHINCPDCPKSFKSQMSYERHIFISHSELQDHPCTICNAKLRSANLLKLHLEQHQNRGKPFACKICGKDFTRPYHLKRHQKYSSCSASENDSMNCKVCDKVFYRLDNLRSHLKQHLGTHVAKKPEYMCPICKNCFYSLSTLNIHNRTHTGERPFDCDLCDKKFPSLVALKKHRRYHTGEKPYTCTVCNQSFAVKEVLNRHMKRHTGDRPHVCSDCGKSFIQATQLRCHLKTHIKPFECVKCKEKFKTEKQLERHVKTHNRKTRIAATFMCEFCSVGFRKKTTLEEHMAKGVHMAKRKRPRKKSQPALCTYCSICDQNFFSHHTLRFHILQVHDVDPGEILDEPTNVKKPRKVDSETSSSDATETTETAVVFRDADKQPTDKASVNNEKTEVESGGVVVKEFIVDEVSTTCTKETIVLQNQSFTIIPLESVGDIVPPMTSHAVPATMSPEDTKKGLRKSLGKSLAAAIADDDEPSISVIEMHTEEDLKLKENVSKLLDMLVDNSTLKKFGWPRSSEETVLCKVIENCGHDLCKESEIYKDCDYATRMREYVKLLFTVVIHNDSIKELLNNYPIDEVIEYVLGNDDEDDDDEDDGDCANEAVVGGNSEHRTSS